MVTEKKNVQKKPKQGYLAAAVREFFSDLSNVKHDDTNLTKALKFAKRYHDEYVRNEFAEDEASKKGFRKSGGGRKFKAPEVREAMFE